MRVAVHRMVWHPHHMQLAELDVLFDLRGGGGTTSDTQLHFAGLPSSPRTQTHTHAHARRPRSPRSVYDLR